MLCVVLSLLYTLGVYVSQAEVMIGVLVICASVVFGGVLIRRPFRLRQWETLPDDVMEKIVPHLSVRDRIRLSSVCKQWKAIPMRGDIPTTPHQLPWLIFPQSCNENLSFFDLHDGKVGKLKLPEPVQGGWFQGCSKGWIIMVMEKDLDSIMFLVNPISGAQLQLPSLSTAPSFQSHVESTSWKRYGATTFSFCLVLSTSDITSEECMIATTFGDAETLCLCRPGDTRWSVIEVLDADEHISELLFSAGKLYALVLSYDKDGFMTAPRTLCCGDQTVELKLVYDKIPIYENGYEDYGDYYVQPKGSVHAHLVESATNGEVYLIHQVEDIIEKKRNICEDPVDGHGRGNDVDEDVEGSDDDSVNPEDDGGGENEEADDDDAQDIADDEEEEDNFVEDRDDANEEHDNMDGNEDGEADHVRVREYVDIVDEDVHGLNTYLRTAAFNVYKLDPNKNKFVGARCLEDQLLFLSATTALSLPAREMNKLKGNCIYFATNNLSKLHPRIYINRELGKFNLDDGRIRRSFPSVKVSVRSQLSWFTPSL